MKAIRFGAWAAAAALALAFTTQPATAGDGEWTTITPHEEVTGFSAARGAADVLYTISETAGVHLSENRGASWTPRNSGLNVTEITAIATAPSNPNRVVVAERGGQLQVSDNRGGSWSASGSAAVSHVTAIVFKPDDDDVIVALDDGQNAVLRSTNGGATWTTHTAGLPSSPGFGDELTMVVVPLLPDTLYAGTADGVYKSEDGGVSWGPVVGEALPSQRALQLIPHPIEPETVAGLFVVGSEIQFWRSNNGGDFWYRPGEDQVAKFRAQSVMVDMHDPSRLLVGGGNGVFGSVDAAHNWVDLNNGLEPDVSADTRTVEAVAFDPIQTLRYYAVSEGVLQVYDGLIATDLVVSATPDPDRVDADGSTTIEFAVANITGEAATNIAFTFTAPAGFEITDRTIDSMDCSQDGGTISCTRAELIPSDTATGTVVAKGTGSEGLHEFTITAIAAEREATPDNNTLKFDVRIGDAPPDSGGGSGGGGSGGGSGGGGSGGGGGGTPQQPEPPRQPPSGGGRSGGGSGGWLWLLGTAAILAARRDQLINRR